MADDGPTASTPAPIGARIRQVMADTSDPIVLTLLGVLERRRQPDFQQQEAELLARLFPLESVVDEAYAVLGAVETLNPLGAARPAAVAAVTDVVALLLSALELLDAYRDVLGGDRA